MNEFQLKSFLILHLYILDSFYVKCELNRYMGININEIKKQKPNVRPSVYVMFDKKPKALENSVTNTKIQNILNSIDEIEYFHNNELDDSHIPYDKLNEYSKPNALRERDSSSSDSSEPSSDTSDSDDSSNEDENFAKRTRNMVQKPKLNATIKEDIENKIEGLHNDLSNADVINKNITLRFGGSCNKGASKSCVTACKGVLKNVCHTYKCSSGMKNRFKHECKSNCKKRFNV